MVFLPLACVFPAMGWVLAHSATSFDLSPPVVEASGWITWLREIISAHGMAFDHSGPCCSIGQICKIMGFKVTWV